MMPRLEQAHSAQIRPQKIQPVRRQLIPEDDRELSDIAIRAIEEGRADHAAGRTVTMAELKRAQRINS